MRPPRAPHTRSDLRDPSAAAFGALYVSPPRRPCPAEFVHVGALPPSAQLQYNMLQVHTFLKLGYTNILAHLDRPPRDDLRNFLECCEAWAYVIAVHHDTEGTLRVALTVRASCWMPEQRRS
jgi:hypothetical protein